MAEENDQDQESKTEDPTSKRLEDAIEKGQVVNSREVNNFLILFCLTLIIIWVMPYIFKATSLNLRSFIEHAGTVSLDRGMIGVILPRTLSKVLLYLSPLFVMVVLIAIFSSYLQHGQFIFTGQQLIPDISRLSLQKGFQRIFSKKSFVEFLKSFFKILLVGSFLYLVIIGDVKELSQYQNLSIGGIFGQLKTMISHIMICVCLIMAVISALDYFYQRFEYFNSLKMTKQEIKEEYKQTEGSPEVKQKIRSLRKEQAKKRIMQTVPKASVIITNPEHYAVALQYNHESMRAPVLVAKGLDLIAQKIKEIARDHDIPIVENPPLARIIYKEVEVNQEIRIEHYEAVAKVISYVMSLKSKKENG